MAVLVNFKICDNAKECSCIQECPVGAFYWDESSKSIAIKDSVCTLCGICENACPVGAVKIAKTEKKLKILEDEYNKDIRTTDELFIDRYGATPINKSYLGNQSKFDVQVLQSVKLIVVELFNEDSIMCLLKSIPIRDILGDIKTNLTYRKIEVTDNSLLEEYKVLELPALLFFKDGNFLGKIEGFYDIYEQDKLINKVKEII